MTDRHLIKFGTETNIRARIVANETRINLEYEKFVKRIRKLIEENSKLERGLKTLKRMYLNKILIPETTKKEVKET